MIWWSLTELIFYEWFSDINECTIQNGFCSHYCNDTIGSYACSCGLGYELSSDMRTCKGKTYKVNNMYNYCTYNIIIKIDHSFNLDVFSKS